MMQSRTGVIFIVSEKISTLKFLPRMDNQPAGSWPAGLTLIITLICFSCRSIKKQQQQKKNQESHEWCNVWERRGKSVNSVSMWCIYSCSNAQLFYSEASAVADNCCINPQASKQSLLFTNCSLFLSFFSSPCSLLLLACLWRWNGWMGANNGPSLK